MNTRQVLHKLRRYESQNVTYIAPDGSWPIVWERARGVHVWDADGNKYLDLTAAFGVAAAGHANARVVRAGQRQMGQLLHAMGDVHPHALKAELARELSRLTFERWATSFQTRNSNRKASSYPEHRAKTIFCNSGFEAVESALKTAMLATGKPDVIAFTGGYHGTGYGALNTTQRAHFRSPFIRQLREFGRFVPFPDAQSERAAVKEPETTVERIEVQIQKMFRQSNVGAILVEPVQVRGGINIPPNSFVPMLRRLCDQHQAVLILDEIYTGLGRTGKWFACEHWATPPDLICLGKALTGGFPLSACVGRADLMDAAWPPTKGEAIHTSTFLGHPVGCAMALEQIKEIRARKLVQRSAELGPVLLSALQSTCESPGKISLGKRHMNPSRSIRAETTTLSTRGLGLLAGLEFCFPDGKPATARALEINQRMLRRGFILLPEGEQSNVLSFTPPLTITRSQIHAVTCALAEVIEELPCD